MLTDKQTHTGLYNIDVFVVPMSILIFLLPNVLMFLPSGPYSGIGSGLLLRRSLFLAGMTDPKAYYSMLKVKPEVLLNTEIGPFFPSLVFSCCNFSTFIFSHLSCGAVSFGAASTASLLPL